MNKRLPYEEQLAEQLKQVLLPDENMAWADMKRRLDEEDDDRIIPFWLNSCFLWTVVVVVILTLGWWLVRPEKWFERKKIDVHRISTNTSAKERPSDLSQKDTQRDSTIFQSSVKRPNRTGQKREIITKKKSSLTSGKNRTAGRRKYLQQKKNKSALVKEDVPLSSNENPDAIAKSSDEEDSLQHTVPAADSVELINQSGAVTNFGTEQKKRNSLPENAQFKHSKRDTTESPKVSFAAGLSLHQQLPIDGQSFVPYNREGRKGTLSDYIPSVYIRMYKKTDWFIQSEFRYGAPQYTKEFLYQQRTDSTFNGTITQSTSLKKTYYHQLPLTFNYFVSKKWSIGAGIVWNRFVSAISSQDVVKHNNLTGTDSVISKGTILVSKISDSGNVFVRSWFQALFEAEYKWKRFSMGARYAMGVEPYIKFELQPGIPQQEKNRSLNIFLRYELWRSKKK